MKPSPKIKFYYNGIKGSDGKLQKAYYSIGNYTAASGIPNDTITIGVSKKNDSFKFSQEIREAFQGAWTNNTDSQSDYFDCDRIRVYSNNPFYPQVLEALKKRHAKFEKNWGAK